VETKLLADAPPRFETAMVALLGVRGAGKSTVGERLARRHAVAFVEVDQRIEAAAGLSLAEIFELHGEAYYRRLERAALDELFASPRAAVLATGGSIVTHADNYALLRGRAVTVWLRARPEDHWNRVIQQGDARPMAENPHAFAELGALLDQRAPLYARAHHAVDTTDCSEDEVVVNKRVARFFARQFFHLLGYRQIEDAGDVLVMRRRRFDETRYVRRPPEPLPLDEE